jgi:hypothetical protein
MFKLNSLVLGLVLLYMLVDTARCQFNPCSSNPCQNGGRCVFLPRKNYMYCICPNAFSGPFCSGVFPSSTSSSSSTDTTTTASTSSTSSTSSTTTTATTTNTTTTTTTTVTTAAANATRYRCADRDYVCQHGGQCYYTVNTTRITCQCRATYTGTFCEQRTSFW